MISKLKGASYLGDAVYVTLEEGMIKLMTADGIKITNCVFLDLDVWKSLLVELDRRGWK